jgi:opacity protein-like surface antigen
MKQIISITFFTILAFNISAQKFYLGVNAGYSFATNAGQANVYDTEETREAVIYEKVKGGLGSGTNVGLRLGYNFNKYIAFELGANYLFGRAVTFEVNNNSYSPMSYDRNTFSNTAKMMQLMPQLVFQAPLSEKLMPYVKFGCVLGLGTKIKEELSNENLGAFTGLILIESKKKTEGNITTGITTTLGANYKIAAKIALFAELHSLSLNYEPETVSYTSYKINGIEQIDNFNTRYKTTIYLDKITETGSIDNEKPNQEIAISIPFSNVSFNIGLRLDL